MENNEELKTLVEMAFNLAKNLQHIAQRLSVFLTADEIVLKRIDNKKFCEINGIKPRTAIRWRKERKIKYSQTKHGITYLLSDVYAFYEKRNGRKKEKPIVANRP